jgi:hypothetical protein
MPAPSSPGPHWLAGSYSILQVAPRTSLGSNFAALGPLGFPLQAKKERVQCPLGHVLSLTLMEVLALSSFGGMVWGGTADNR